MQICTQNEMDFYKLLEIQNTVLGAKRNVDAEKINKIFQKVNQIQFEM